VARSTIYRNDDVWAAIDLLRETDDGYRLALSFREVERYEDLWPWFVDDADDLFATMPDLVDPLLEELHPDDYLQLTDLLYPPDGPLDLDALREAAPVLSRWPERLQVALGEACPEQLAVFGEVDPSQTSIRDSGSTLAQAAD
jgi:hypothetical protein